MLLTYSVSIDRHCPTISKIQQSLSVELIMGIKERIIEMRYVLTLIYFYAHLLGRLPLPLLKLKLVCKRPLEKAN